MNHTDAHLAFLKAYVRYVLQLEADLDPRFEHELNNLILTYQALKENADQKAT